MGYRACKQRNHPEGGTPFRDWIRMQKGLESNTRVGYVGTDIDLIWYNYNLAMLMILEEKQYMAEVGASQEAVESILHQALRFALNHPDLTFYSLRKPVHTKITYCGCHLIQFEKTGPEDGATYIDGVLATKQDLIKFLQFKWTPSIQCYVTQQEMIRSAYSRQKLDEVAVQIKQSVYSSHPEITLLRRLWSDKAKELSSMETMFTAQDSDEDIYPHDNGMAEAERILRFRDFEALRESGDQQEKRSS